MREERIELSQGERDRLKVLHHVEQGYLTQAEAGQLGAGERGRRGTGAWCSGWSRS